MSAGEDDCDRLSIRRISGETGDAVGERFKLRPLQVFQERLKGKLRAGAKRFQAFAREERLWTAFTTAFTIGAVLKTVPGLTEYEVVFGILVGVIGWKVRKVCPPRWRWAPVLLGAVLALVVGFYSPTGRLVKVQLRKWEEEIPLEHRIWEIDLLENDRFEYAAFARDGSVSAGGSGVPVNVGFELMRRGEGLRLLVPGNHTAELKRAVTIPRHHLGKVFLRLQWEGVAGEFADPASLQIVRDARDPVILDTFWAIQYLNRSYDVTSQAGGRSVLWVRIASGEKAGLELRLRRYMIESVPPSGTVLIEARKSWDRAKLDGYQDDLWFRIEKFEKGRYLLFRKVKMGKEGFTRDTDIPPGSYRISAVLNSIVLEELGKTELTDEAGWYGRFWLPLAKPIDLIVLRRDGATPLAGAGIIVETNRPDGGPVRGIGAPEHLISTDETGRSTKKVWLYPAMNPEVDYYVVRVRYKGREVGRKSVRVGPDNTGFEVMSVLTDLGTGE